METTNGIAKLLLALCLLLLCLGVYVGAWWFVIQVFDDTPPCGCLLALGLVIFTLAVVVAATGG